ncbi:MAG: hypothetical protein ACR2IK_08805 [Chloroflexota bacterium]
MSGARLYLRRVVVQVPSGVAPGRGARQHGKVGEDLIVAVPQGTQVRSEGGFSADLVHPGDRSERLMIPMRNERGVAGEVFGGCRQEGFP